MRQVTGQHIETLQQAGNDDGGHHQWKHAHDLTDRVGDQQHRSEGRKRRGHGGHDRFDHHANTVFSGHHGAVPHFKSGVGVFAHDDGIVDNDAEHHDQTEQRNHIDRLA